MRLARKLFLLGAMALAALALAASPASAQFEVTDEVTEEHCGAITVDNHDVTGGCHVEFEGIDIPLNAYIPAKATISNCEVNLEGQIDENGEGYADEATFDTPDVPTGVPCSRAPCDEDTGAGDEMVPWPFHLVEHGASDEEIQAEFCLRTITSGEGGPRTWCDIELEFTNRGQHRYEIGHLVGPNDGAEVFCSNNPNANPPYTGPHPVLMFPVSIDPHFVTHGEASGTEDVEIIH